MDSPPWASDTKPVEPLPFVESIGKAFLALAASQTVFGTRPVLFIKGRLEGIEELGMGAFSYDFQLLHLVQYWSLQALNGSFTALFLLAIAATFVLPLTYVVWRASTHVFEADRSDLNDTEFVELWARSGVLLFFALTPGLLAVVLAAIAFKGGAKIARSVGDWRVGLACAVPMLLVTSAAIAYAIR